MAADSDSENEGILTNIQRLVIRPPGHTGKAKKGHVCFDGARETMNLGRVDFISDHEYDVYVRPDTANPRNRFWFHFTVENTQKDQRVIFNVVNLSKSKSLFGCTPGLTPQVKSTSRPRWQRMPTQHVFYYRSPIHRDNFVLSFAFCFDLEYMDNLSKDKHDFLRITELASSIQGRPLHLLTITDPRNLLSRSDRIKQDIENDKVVEPEEDDDDDDDNDEIDGKKLRDKRSPTPTPGTPVVVLLCRQHAGESPSSFVCQGLIDFLVSNHEVARELRERVVFKVLPMMNPDGVFLGNTRGNLLGQDLNRKWMEPDPHAHPTVCAVKRLIEAILEGGADGDENEEGDLELDTVLDLHSHSSLHGLFIYGNSYDDVYRFERHLVLPKILAQNCPEDFSQSNTIYNANPQKVGTARRQYAAAVNKGRGQTEVNSYTLEVSALGYKDEESGTVVPYTEDMYCRVGRNLARAFWDYFKIMGYIPLDPSECNGELDEKGRPKSAMGAGGVRSFNLLRLREIAQQRDETARTFDGAGDEDDVANRISNAKQSTASTYNPLRRNFNRNKSCSSFYSEDLSTISSPGRISAVVNLADGTVTDAGAEGDVSESDDGDDSNDDIYKRLTPIVTPAPRVTFVGTRREQHPDLTVLPAKSASIPESPFVSPQKKKHLKQSKRVRSNFEGLPTNSPDISELPTPLLTQHPSILSRHQVDLESDIFINGIKSTAIIKPNNSSSKNSYNRRKIGGGAVVSATPHSPAPRPQSLTPALTSYVQEGRTVGLPQQQQQQQQHRRRQMAVVDFSKMAEESPEKQQHVRRRKKQKSVLIKT